MDKSGKRRSGQLRKIPAFGNWDSVNDMPITQYFESAREAGLTRFSSSSDDLSAPSSGDLYSHHHHHHQHHHYSAPPRTKKERGGEKRGPPQMKEATRGGRQAVKVYDLPTAPPTNKLHNDVVSSRHHQLPRVPPSRTRRAPKAVDEDLYKIPVELLHQSHKKKKLGFISRCLVMPCTA